MYGRMNNMLNALLSINVNDNSQIGPIVYSIIICVAVGIIIATIILKIRDKNKEKTDREIDTEWHAEQVLHGVNRRSKKASKDKQIQQIKRETRDPKKKAEEEAAAKNTLLGGRSEAQLEEKGASEVFGSLGISSKKAEEIDKAKEQIIINGYLQKSNTAPIRPVYSNTLEARQQQRKELESDKVGKEAETPALVMDSAAPSVVKITEAAPQKVKPTALKRPTAARVTQGEEEELDTTYGAAIKPQLGTEVSNAVIDRPATVQEEKPEILKSGARKSLCSCFSPSRP